MLFYLSDNLGLSAAGATKQKSSGLISHIAHFFFYLFRKFAS
ncbi:hypothetical protein CU019_2681 [Enterococcus faecium]|nr:hypothetical protein [Enterococcus faecium]MBK4791774.1 hypothetical protein [Enterococcus faecium]MBK4799865.1 hypothetical protein [Enterococcus faecium]MBK4821323.1 hypothetical protein [Enterococcus faecium]MBK4830939.1 hypothetical protein [Enterococcus faecium]